MTTSPKKRNATPPVKGRPFPKGVSGNPGGLAEWQRQAKALMKENAPAAVKIIVDTMNDPTAKHKDRLSAAQYIVDQACGKAVQKIGTDDEGSTAGQTLVLTWATPPAQAS